MPEILHQRCLDDMAKKDSTPRGDLGHQVNNLYASIDQLKAELKRKGELLDTKRREHDTKVKPARREAKTLLRMIHDEKRGTKNSANGHAKVAEMTIDQQILFYERENAILEQAKKDWLERDARDVNSPLKLLAPSGKTTGSRSTGTTNSIGNISSGPSISTNPATDTVANSQMSGAPSMASTGLAPGASTTGSLLGINVPTTTSDRTPNKDRGSYIPTTHETPEGQRGGIRNVTPIGGRQNANLQNMNTHTTPKNKLGGGTTTHATVTHHTPNALPNSTRPPAAGSFPATASFCTMPSLGGKGPYFGAMQQGIGFPNPNQHPSPMHKGLLTQNSPHRLMGEIGQPTTGGQTPNRITGTSPFVFKKTTQTPNFLPPRNA